MTEPIVIPSIVAVRWQEALADPTMPRWRSLAQMLSSMVVNSSIYTPGSPVVDDLRTLAHVAHIHQLSLQPRREEARVADAHGALA